MAMKRFGLRSRLVLTLAAMLAIALYVLWPVLNDPRGTEVTRLRNALLAERGVPQDFVWTPDNWPADFQREQLPVPLTLSAWHGLQNANAETAWLRALQLAKALTGQPRRGNAIAKPTLTTLRLIETTGAGYCADYTKVFMALSHAAGIPSRQWSFSFDGFGGWGHTFNEVWDESTGGWRMIDVFNGFYPRDQLTGEPLSALAFRQLLLQQPERLIWERLEAGRFGFKSDAEAERYFRHGADEWYLWWGNDPLSYDSNPLVASAARFGRLPEQGVGWLTGALPRFRILLTDGNSAAVSALMQVKYTLWFAAVLELLLGLLLLSLLWNGWQKRRHRHSHPVANG